MSNYYIPEDIIFNILSWLPGKSLLGFTTVCKLWQSIISNPQVINTHLANSHKKQARIAILTKVVDPIYKNLTPEINITHEEFIKLTLPRQCNGMPAYIFSSNGLICLAKYSGGDICVWNPLTKRLKIASTLKEKIPKRHLCCMGFGYDPISNDYKILKMVDLSHVVEAELYSSNDDCWKEIQVPTTIPSSIIYTILKCVQLETGILYMDGLMKLVSFDLHNEVFGVYPYPLHHIRTSHVLIFEDSVAMIFKSIGDGTVSLWTLDNICGRKMSWIKRFKLEADWKINWVYFILGFGQILAENYDVGYFFYDYKKKASKKVCKDMKAVKLQAVKYTESLVSLKGFEKQQ